MNSLLRAAWAALLGSVACFAMRSSHGGGQTSFAGSRRADPQAVALPTGYRIEAVATGLNFPTGVAFDAQGRPYVTESGYSYGEAWTTPRFDPSGAALYVVEFGVMTMGPHPKPAFGTGVLWRITRAGSDAP